jgi:hypothetical protein
MVKQSLRSLIGNRFIRHRGNEGDPHRSGLQPELARRSLEVDPFPSWAEVPEW